MFQKLIPNRNTPEATTHNCIKTKGIENVQFMLSYTPTSRHHGKEISSLMTRSYIYFSVSNFPSKMLFYTITLRNFLFRETGVVHRITYIFLSFFF